MKNSRLLVAAAVSGLLLSGVPVAHAEPSPVTGVELNVDVADSVAVATQYNLGSNATEGLQALKQLRRTMWKNNPPYVPGYLTAKDLEKLPAQPRLQDVAKLRGISTVDEFVAVEIDSQLMNIALQRALENQAFSGLTIQHTRPDGNPIRTVADRNLWAENLGVSTGPMSLSTMIKDRWGGQKEYQALLASKGLYDTNNGHLYNLIDPELKAYGFARVRAQDNRYFYASYADTAVMDSSPMDDELVSVWNYRPPRPGEKPTGVKKGSPRFAAPVQPGLSPGVGGGAEGSGGGGVMGVITAIVSILSVIAAIAQFAGQFAPRPH